MRVKTITGHLVHFKLSGNGLGEIRISVDIVSCRAVPGGEADRLGLDFSKISTTCIVIQIAFGAC
jgi:hypothetical protein